MKRMPLFAILAVVVLAALAGLAAVILFWPRATEDQAEPDRDEQGREQ